MLRKIPYFSFINDHISSWLKRRRAMSFYSSFIHPNDLCFDIGANIGDKIDLFRQMKARVIAVEPQPLCVEKIRNRFVNDKNVEVLNVALGESNGVEEMYVCSAIDVLSTLSRKWIEQSRFSTNRKVQWDKKIEVLVITLDDLISQYGVPKFCKIDVEGYEKEVISGLSRKMEYLSFEFMYEFLDDSKTICDYFEQIGNVKSNYSLRDDFDIKSFSRRGWRKCEDIISELKKYDDPKLWGDIYIKFE